VTLHAGLDIGALWTKAAVLRDGALAGCYAAPTGDDSARAAGIALRAALGQAGAAGENALEALAAVAVTGAGKARVGIDGAQPANEVLCVARGIHRLHPEVRGVIDLGGEATRVVKLDARGEVLEFALNDKCAAGTGVFLDAMAKVLGVPVEEMGAFAQRSTAEVSITSTCVAFAESEVVSQVHRQTPKQDILHGLHKSIASRVFSLSRRVDLEGAVALCGGLARNVGIVTWLQTLRGEPLTVPAQPQIVSALGAALIAAAGGAA